MIRSRSLFALLALFALSLAGVVRAQTTPTGAAYDGDAFVHYEPYVVTPKDADQPASAPVAPPPPSDSSKSTTGKTTVDVAWLRKNYPLLLDRAINDPTDANVQAYLLTQRIIMDRSQRFSEAVSKVTREDPVLNENNRVPYSSTGAQSVRNADYQAQEKAVQELSKIGGLLVFVDGECRFCAMELPVLDMLKRTDNIEYLVISIDGTRPHGFTGPITADNGLYNKLGLKLTPSIVYVAHPRAYSNGQDPNQYLIVSQGFYAADELRKQIAYAGHSTDLLSASTMRDLDVWDRGVATTHDLQNLRLDPNDPGSFRDAIEPFLLKQYQK